MLMNLRLILDYFHSIYVHKSEEGFNSTNLVPSSVLWTLPKCYILHYHDNGLIEYGQDISNAACIIMKKIPSL